MMAANGIAFDRMQRTAVCCAVAPCVRATLLASFLAIAGCASTGPKENAMRLLAAGQVDTAVKLLDDAVADAPRDVVLRAERARVRELAAAQYLMLAESLRANDQTDDARASYLKLLALEPGNARAAEGLRALDAEARHRIVYREALGHLEARREEPARALLQQIMRENPQQRDARALMRSIDEKAARLEATEPRLKIDLQRPITFDLRDATLRTAFEFVTKASGLNVFFDKDVKTDQRVSVLAKDTRLENLIQLILVTNQLERKVVADNAILVYPSTPQKIREYQDLVSKTFYLVNADVRQVQNLVRTMVKTKDIYIDEKLNMLVMRDTPEAVRYAEKLIAGHDLAEPEVMLQVEVMEIARNRLTDLGVRFPEQIGLTPTGANNTAGSLPLYDALNLNSRMVQFTITNPSIVLNLKNQEGLTNLLANPRIRVKNRERARILIGDRVPVITSTSTATGFVAESVNYLDVGIRLEVEPNVFLEDEVQIRVGLEVSNIAREIRGSTGTLTYQVGTRNAATTLRLRDGETQVLAGLISDEDRSTSARLPGLSNLPIAGRLFSSTAETRSKTEIVLLITPRILRNIQRPDAAISEFYAGTEAAVGSRPLFLRRVADGVATSAPPPSEVPTTQPPATTRSVPSVGPSFGPASGSLLLPPADQTDRARPTPQAQPSAPPLAFQPPGPTPPGQISPPPGGSVPPGSAGVPMATLRWNGPSEVRRGEVFELALQLASARGVTSASAVVQLDTSGIQFVEARAGGFFERGGAKSTLNVRSDPSGLLQMNVTGDPAKGIAGQGDLLILRLRAVGSADTVRVVVSTLNAVGDGGATLPSTSPPPFGIRVVP